ncbi:MAG: mannose-1-phosphate guanylyltransferase [Leptospiraceae bacterium]|nr:mannose-1-phosphate guanylyltransferase [Leptospiraceae bacterium]
MNEKPVVLIMAGGKGERFWPRSRESTPKQLQKVYSNKTLLKETIDRALTITSLDRIYIGTNPNLKKSILKSEPKFPKTNFILEPEAKNTAPIVALASLYFKKKYGNPIQVVLSADAYIHPIKEFTKNLQEAIRTAKTGNLVLLGVKPTRPETGYGYIATGKMGINALKVQAFYEKPDLKLAMKYFKKKNFYWNPGIFIWQTNSILQEFERYSPYILKPIQTAFQSKSALSIPNAFKQIPSEAIDTAIMEKTSSILMVKTSFNWDDVGSWLSLERVLVGDKNQNFHIGNKSFHYSSTGNISSVQKELIVFLGTKDLVVVEEDDLLFVASKSGISEIKKLIAELRKNKDLQKYLL